MTRRVSRKAAPKAKIPATTAKLTEFEPRHPALAATACFSLWIAILSIPMLSGAFLASPINDQYSSGYAFRAWAAEWWKKLGHVPLWNPEIFGGMPFLAGMSGDVLYPTAWLRLVLPTHVAMNLGFAIHYVLAGLFAYWFLRRWRVTWTGAVVGGLTYQLSGVIGSYVSPGHDGKLFVTTMLPLLLLGLTLGVRDRRFSGYAIAALAVGLIMLSPHPQMAQYALLAAGIFTLFLVFGEGTVTSTRDRLTALGLALAAVMVGVGVSAAQYLPFYAYIPYSPRDATVLHDFEWSARYAIPWLHVPEFVIPRFTGESFNESYWGPNGIKLHSEYLGLVPLALAAVGAMERGRRRMVVWLAATAALFLLVALGSGTPFYRLWWEVVPFATSMRAPGMALFIVSFVIAVLAAFGTDRVSSGQSPRFATAAMIAGGGVALLGVTGVFGAMTESLGSHLALTVGLRDGAERGSAAAQAVRWGALGAGLALAAAGVALTLRMRDVLSARVAAIVIVATVGTDLWLNARAFWTYSRAPEELFADDEIKSHLRGIPRPFRVWDVDFAERGVRSVYPGAALMADGIPQLYGHHANEPHAFDRLNGIDLSRGPSRAGHPRILDLFAVNHVIVQAAAAADSFPGFRRTLSNVATSSGTSATLFERVVPVPYARFIPAAAPSTLEESVRSILSPDFPIDRLVLLDSVPGMKAGTVPNPLPASMNIPITIERWVPGAMLLRLTTAPAAPGYVLVSENWDRPWRATVDGREVGVQRGDATLITVPVRAGARTIELRYESTEYQLGRAISLASLAVIVLAIFGSMSLRWRRAQMSTREGESLGSQRG
jgi:hypothetical protein